MTISCHIGATKIVLTVQEPLCSESMHPRATEICETSIMPTKPSTDGQEVQLPSKERPTSMLLPWYFTGVAALPDATGEL
eukprot:m.351130 g.351130  ORF g.351130 m.351130 type:complete len:80 (-) comp20695_c0_seq22:265-504(-)